jgi:hypothetical protein
VRYGYDISEAQIESLAAVGLLPGAELHVMITHIHKSSIIRASSPKGANGVPLMSGERAIAALEGLLAARTKGGGRGGGGGGGGGGGAKAAVVQVFREQLWEWPALDALWRRANELRAADDDNNNDSNGNDNDNRGSGGGGGSSSNRKVILYMHNKGCTHVADGRGALLTSPDFRHETLETGFGRRQLVEMAAFANVVSPWRTVLRLFDERGDKVQHAGVARKQAS